MNNSEIRALSTEELKDKIASSEKSLQNLKFANAVTPLENPMQIRDSRQFVSRLKTELHARTLEMVREKVASGELDQFNARKFLAETSFDSSLNLAKIKKIIAQGSNR